MRTLDRFSIMQWFILWALMLCVLFAAVPLGASQPVSWTLLSLAILVIFLLQVIIDSPESLPKQTKGLWLPALLFLGTIAWAWVQLLPVPSKSYAHPVWTTLRNVPGHISADPGQGHQIIMRYLCYAMIFWIAFRGAVVSSRAGTMLKTIAVISTAFAGYGLYTLVIGNNPLLADGAQGPVVTATFIDRNSYATYAAFGFLANIATYLHIVSGAQADEEYWQGYLSDMLEVFFDGAWIYAVGALMCLAALVLTQSRVGGIATLAGLIVLLASWKRKDQRLNPWILFVVCAVVGLVTLSNVNGITNMLWTAEAESGRFLIYPEVVRGIVDRPLLGHGLGAFQDAFRQYVPADVAADEWVRAHNSYIENVFEMGIPASIAFYLALLVITFRIYRGTVIREQNRAFSCFALAVIVTSATHALVDFSLQVPAITALFAVIVAMGWAQSFSLRPSRG